MAAINPVFNGLGLWLNVDESVVGKIVF